MLLKTTRLQFLEKLEKYGDKRFVDGFYSKFDGPKNMGSLNKVPELRKFLFVSVGEKTFRRKTNFLR